MKTSTGVPAASQGVDAGKKIVGRKRSIVTDTLGLLLAVVVTAAGVQGSVAGTHLVNALATAHPTIRKVWVDGGYRQHLVEHAARLGIDVEIVRRTPGARGFTPSRNDGLSNAPMDGRCSTAAWHATTKPSPNAPKP